MRTIWSFSAAAMFIGPEGAIVDATFPGLVLTGGGAVNLWSYTGLGATDGAGAQIARLVP